MSCNVETYPSFDREAKRLAKKYKSLKSDIQGLIQDLQKNPLLGTELHPGIRKVRMAIASKGRGKSGGARIITVIVDTSNPPSSVGLLTIYDKSEMSSISDKQIDDLLHQLA